MDNDEQMEKVMHELVRRNKIAEEHFRHIKETGIYYDLEYADLALIANEAFEFVREDLIKYGLHDYSTSKYFIETAGGDYKHLHYITSWEITSDEYDTMIIYIGKVIDDISNNHYPDDPYEIFNGVKQK